MVRARFYEPEKAALHAALAAYCYPPAGHPDTDPPLTRRGFIELPFQLFHAGMPKRLDALPLLPGKLSPPSVREVVASCDVESVF